mmetsp:Transcript_6169/g.20107  ORF Transcript_6169/g.20107 Transcript_6169/m.20107 type:complete len:165 (-) Transcript_6169:13-507(-)
MLASRGRHLSLGRALLPFCSMLSSSAFVAVQPRRPRRLLATSNSNSFELEGSLLDVGKLQEFDSGRAKREFVLRTKELYPQDVKFDLWGDKTDLLGKLPLDSDIAVSFNIRGNGVTRDGNTRYFVNLTAWRIQLLPSKRQDGRQAEQRQPYTPVVDYQPDMLGG